MVMINLYARKFRKTPTTPLYGMKPFFQMPHRQVLPIQTPYTYLKATTEKVKYSMVFDLEVLILILFIQTTLGKIGYMAGKR